MDCNINYFSYVCEVPVPPLDCRALTALRSRCVFLRHIVPARTDPFALLGRAGSDRGATRAGAGFLFTQKRRGARIQGSSEGQTRTFPFCFFAQITRSVQRNSFGNLVKMSRKKTVKGKAASHNPSAGSPAGNSPVKAAKSSPGIVPMNGVVHPSRPSVSCSSEFYDIAFKVRRLPACFHSLNQPLAPVTGERCRHPAHAACARLSRCLVAATAAGGGHAWALHEGSFGSLQQ